MSLLSRVFAQVNPFDNGKTYKNTHPQPQQQRPAPPPQPRVNAQQLMQALQQQQMQRNVPQPPKQLHPDVQAAINRANQAKQQLASKTQDPISHALQVIGRDFIARPAAEIAATAQNKTVKPTNAVSKAVLGKEPVKPIQETVRGTYRAVKGGGATLPGNIPIPQNLAPEYAAANAALHIANDVPVAGGVTKGAIKGVKALDTAALKAAQLKPAVEIGAVGKNVNKDSEFWANQRAKSDAHLRKTNVQITSGAASKATPQELKIGKALGMSEQDIHEAKTPVITPSSTPKPAGTIKTVPETVKVAGKNPIEGQVGVPVVQTGDAGQAHLNAQFVANHEKRVGNAAQLELGKLSSKDQTLMQDIQTKGVKKVAKRAENPQQFIKTESALRDYYNLRHAYDKHLGIDTPYRQNYLRDLIPPQEGDATFAAQGGNKAPGYTKAKTKLGVTPVAEGLQRDIAGSSFNHGKLTYAKGLEEAFPGQISRGSPIVGQEGVTQQLTTPYGNELFATKDVAGGINNRAQVGKAEGALGKYDSVNAFAKYLKLSGGAFHAFTEGGNFVGHQLVTGKLFTEPGSTAKVFKTFFSQKALDKEVSALEANGTFDKARLGGLTWTPKEIKADVDVTPHSKAATYTGIKALHDATFQRELPYIKLKMFEQATQGLDVNNPEELNQIRQTATAINSGIGGINRLVSGLTPKQAKAAARMLLATDFTEGKIRTVAAALSKGGVEGKLARQLIAGKALVFGGLATAGAGASGELQNKNPQEIAADVLGKFIDPKFTVGDNTVSLPATHVSEFTKPLESFTDGSKDKFSGLKHYATARLAAVPSEANQLINNLDYTGNHIYGKNTKKNGGEPFTPAQTAVNVAKGVLPIPFSQGVSTVQGKQSVPAAIGNIAGLRVSPTPEKDKSVGQSTGGKDNLTADQRIKQAFSSKDKTITITDQDGKTKKISARDFVQLSAADQKAAAGLDPDAREVYKELQGAKKAFSKPGLRPEGLDEKSTKTLDKFDRFTTDGKNKYLARNPSAEFDLKVAQYNANKASGKLDAAGDIKARKALTKLDAGKNTPKDIRDLYSLSKADVMNFVTNDSNGKEAYNKLVAYDQALLKAGVIKKSKFSGGSSGSTYTRVGRKSSSGRSSGGTVKIAKLKLGATPKVQKVSIGNKGKSSPKRVSFKKGPGSAQTKKIKIA